jgi:hypothetical protein
MNSLDLAKSAPFRPQLVGLLPVIVPLATRIARDVEIVSVDDPKLNRCDQFVQEYVTGQDLSKAVTGGAGASFMGENSMFFDTYAKIKYLPVIPDEKLTYAWKHYCDLVIAKREKALCGCQGKSSIGLSRFGRTRTRMLKLYERLSLFYGKILRLFVRIGTPLN